MADTEPGYISAAAFIVDTILSSPVGVNGWPTNRNLQEERVALYQTLFHDAKKLLREIYDDFYPVKPIEELLENTLEPDEPLQTHADMWRSVHTSALTLTRPGLLNALSSVGYLNADHTAVKDVACFLPISNSVQSTLEEVRQQNREYHAKFETMVDSGLEVTEEEAQKAWYQRWKRSYAVLKSIVKSLYCLLEKINEWLTYKVSNLQVAHENLQKAIGQSENMNRESRGRRQELMRQHLWRNS